MDRSQHGGSHLGIRTRLHRLFKKDGTLGKFEDEELYLRADRSDRSGRSRKSTSRRRSSHEPIDDFSEDDSIPRPRRRGHDYRNVQARENGRMQLGDNTYITTQNVYHDLKHPGRVGNDGAKIDLRSALAFDHMDTRLASISVARGETCRWLFNTAQYREWLACPLSSHHRFLWIKGKPGAGKSTMMKCALEEARNYSGAIVASFFFNARGHGTATTTEGMYRALLHQIFTQLARLPTAIPAKVAAIWKEEVWPISMLQRILSDTICEVGKNHHVILYIDALDECAEKDMREALHHLEEVRDLAVRHGLRFHACFASRRFPNITIRYCQELDLDKQEKHGQDITDYVDNVLRAPKHIHAELTQDIVARADGIFLWAVLTVGILNEMRDGGAGQTELRVRMRKIPTGIEDLFRDILKHKNIYLLPTLLWILYAKRPLKVPELYFAVRASTYQHATGIWNPAEIDLEGMRSFVLTCSRGLVDSSGEVPQLLHESLREFLVEKGLAELDPDLRIDLEVTCHTRLAQWCLAYPAPDTERYLGPDFGSTDASPTPDDWDYYKRDHFPRDSGLAERRTYHFKTTEQLPFLGYVITQTINHIRVGFGESKVPAATLGRFADLWLTLRLDRSCSYATGHCAALLCFTLARSHDGATITRTRSRSPTSPASTSFSKTQSRPAEGDSYRYLILEKSETLCILRVAAEFSTVDSFQLLNDRKVTSDFKPLLGAALNFSAGAGSESILDLLISNSTYARFTMLAGPLRVAALDLQEGTTRLLLRRAIFGERAFRQVHRILKDLAEYSDPENFHGDAEKARLNIAAMLLNRGAKLDGCLEAAILTHDKRSRPSLVRLFVASGARMSSSELQVVRAKAHDPEILRLLDELHVPILDTPDGSDYSDASTEAVVIHPAGPAPWEKAS